MADKNGNLQQRRGARFSNAPITGMNMCPFKAPEVAIVPMRYALDRSRYDVDPTQLRPLSAEGRWASLPMLKTRGYTLRQLRDGFVYVYDETAKTLHEYRYSAQDASLTRIVWGDAEIGQDQRNSAGDSRNHLLYPRNNRLHIGFSPQQWTWRVCEHLRSHADSRALWMQPLDLKEYCRSMDVPHALPLMDLDKNTVADVDVWPIKHDGRFADSAHPPTAADGPSQHLVPLAADVIWTGGVDDKFSAVMIALDDPLAVMEDFGMQLSADQARLQQWQAEHGHKVNMAGIVEHLCGVGGDTSLLPAAVIQQGTSRKYLADVERYFEQLNVEEDAGQAEVGVMYGLQDPPSRGLKADIIKTYGGEPSAALRDSWEQRSKWRREVDLNGARGFVDEQQQQRDLLRQQVTDTQHDLKLWAERIGTEPLKLFIDTTHPKTLLYLQTLIADQLEILGQDLSVSQWLMQEDQQAKTLFGLARFGFSMGLKNAFDDQAKQLVKDHNDITALIGRAGELNSFLRHDEIASRPWMQALSEPLQKTFQALGELAKGAGKEVFEKTLLALLAVESRLAHGQTPGLWTLLRNTLVGHFLLNHPERLQLDPDFGDKLKQWKADLRTLQDQYRSALYKWFHDRKNYGSREVGKYLAKRELIIKQHMQRLPGLFDYQKSRYVKIIQGAIVDSVVDGLSRIKWPEQVQAWSEKQGLNAGLVTWGVVIANLVNTAFVYRDLTRDGGLNRKDLAKLASAAAYSASAMMVVFVETKWASLKDLSVDVKGKEVSILKRSASFWDHAPDHTKSWGKHIRGFGARLVGVGGFALLATSAEMWDIVDDYSAAQSSTDRKFLLVKLGAVFGMWVVGLGQLIAGAMALAGNPAALTLIMHPWVAASALIAGLVYLFATFALNYLSRDAIGQWLRKCSWSRYPDERLPDTPSGHAEENRAFLEIQLSPTLYVKPTYKMESRYVPRIGYQQFPVQNGAWVQLHLPAELRGSLLKVNLTASHRPFYVMPVETLDQSLQGPFVAHGVVKDAGSLGSVPDQPWSRELHDTDYEMPTAGESTVWQTWVPLTEDAQFLELQVWYPPEVLTSGEDDRGYRFQLELEKDGVTDQKDTRLSSLDTSSLQVQTLGGRAEAVFVPVPI